ncbi:predicted protein [Naegleria gruberi]|uniref:Predicted protein n=1 Tax=Naegleria gruberi TaxID=5762 RepID=D2W2Y3_NAEGR|nr:uncharacterized protein NAEGRDRAFT_75753 [Naegleria gruberi]EFC36597.1 predicted protein [Naegleria gruberi]|eukprot:XP_002669341.1 predicted protein [Naegleria gruberi strain NEG-M]
MLTPSHSLSLLHLMLTSWFLTILLFYTKPIVSLSSSSSSSFIQYISSNKINELNSSTIIIGANNFINLYLWKDLEIYSIGQLLNSTNSQKELNFFSYDTNGISENDMIRMIRILQSNNFALIPSKWKFKQVVMQKNTECLYGSLFERFDILIGTADEFAERVRLSRGHQQRRKKSFEYLNPNDFYIIPLFPRNFYIVTMENYNHLNLFESEFYNYFISNSRYNQTNCLESIKHDSSIIEHLHGILYFTSLQIDWSLQYFNISHIPYNNSIISNFIFSNLFESNDYIWNYSKVSQHLWESTCYHCTTTSCVAENWTWGDSLDLTVVCSGVLFYAILLISGAFKSPVVYRKYGIIFLSPFLNMGLFTALLNAFNNSCISLGTIFSNYAACLMNIIYICTVLRYFYLRNLYNFVKSSKYPSLYKYLAGEMFGFFFTIIIPMIFTLIFPITIIVLVGDYNADLFNLANNLIIAILAAVSCIAGFSTLIFDAIKNRKIISKFGFSRFFIFEDPYFFRIDLLSLPIIFLLLVLLAIIFMIAPIYVLIVRFLIGMTLYLLFGTSLVMLIVEQLKFKTFRIKSANDEVIDKNQQEDITKEYIEMIKENKNEDLCQLFKLYCQKSLALENLMLMDVLIEKKRKSTSISVEDMKHIKEEFLISYSAYEVNISSQVRQNFEQNLQDALSKNEAKVNNEILTDLMVEIETNIKSTFMRFAKTSEFLEWQEIYSLQKERAVL